MSSLLAQECSKFWSYRIASPKPIFSPDLQRSVHHCVTNQQVLLLGDDAIVRKLNVLVEYSLRLGGQVGLRVEITNDADNLSSGTDSDGINRSSWVGIDDQSLHPYDYSVYVHCNCA